jgi:excisionase family DNA binding protein
MADQPALPKVYFSVDEVAEMLHIEKSTLYNWSYRNYGPPRYKFGGHLRYPSDELFAWIEEQKMEGSDVR